MATLGKVVNLRNFSKVETNVALVGEQKRGIKSIGWRKTQFERFVGEMTCV